MQLGALAGIAYVIMLLNVVRGLKSARLVEGTVAAFEGRHPVFRWLRTGPFIPKGGTEPTATVVLAEWAVKKFVYPGMTLQVLVLLSPTQEMSRVVAVRSPVRLG